MTAFLKTDAAILQGEQVGQAEPAEQAEQAGQSQPSVPVQAKKGQNEKKIKIDLTKKMLMQVDEKTKILQGKISPELFERLTAADFRAKIDILNNIADEAMSRGNFFLSAECATVKNFILYRCFSKSEIEQIRVTGA